MRIFFSVRTQFAHSCALKYISVSNQHILGKSYFFLFSSWWFWSKIYDNWQQFNSGSIVDTVVVVIVFHCLYIFHWFRQGWQHVFCIIAGLAYNHITLNWIRWDSFFFFKCYWFGSDFYSHLNEKVRRKKNKPCAFTCWNVYYLIIYFHKWEIPVWFDNLSTECR